MALRGVEITTEDELSVMFDALVSIYADVENTPEGVVICPRLNPITHPTFDAFLGHLEDPNVRILAVKNDDEFLIVGLFVEGRGLTAAWAGSDRQTMTEAAYALAEFFEAEGRPYVLSTNMPGWINRVWFEDYMLQGDGGPFDTSVSQPGLDGRTYADVDDEKWTLTIWRETPEDEWSWKVEVI